LKHSVTIMQMNSFDNDDLINNMPSQVLVLDEAYKILYINHTVPQIKKESLIGIRALNQVTGHDRRILAAMYDQVLEEGGQGQVEINLVNAARIFAVHCVSRAARYVKISADVLLIK